MSDDIFKIRGDRPAVRIQEAILSVDRKGKAPEVWRRETLLAAWVQTSIEGAYVEKESPITMGAIVRCDNMASGHVDWVSKFPLYCEDLISKLKRT